MLIQNVRLADREGLWAVRIEQGVFTEILEDQKVSPKGGSGDLDGEGGF